MKASPRDLSKEEDLHQKTDAPSMNPTVTDQRISKGGKGPSYESPEGRAPTYAPPQPGRDSGIRWGEAPFAGEATTSMDKDESAPERRRRDLAAYWSLSGRAARVRACASTCLCLGFCNNFTYWVMITAAYDLLSPPVLEDVSESERPSSADNNNNSGNNSRIVYSHSDSHSYSPDVNITTSACQRHSTGAVLVADTVPASVLTALAPFVLLLEVNLRVGLIGTLCIASYLILGVGPQSWVFVGVAVASASRGFSDTTFLGYASFYPADVLSLWSSGTGVATFVGPLTYSGLTTVGLRPNVALMVFLVVPVAIFVSYWLVLGPKPPIRKEVELGNSNNEFDLERDFSGKSGKTQKIKLYLRALKRVLPLCTFYLIMYFTNQGLLEIIYFPTSPLTHAQQYSWSNTTRCLGTLISRSAHKFVLLPNVWVYIPFVLTIMLVLGAESYWHFLPSELIVFGLLLIQGLLEGSAFRSTIFGIREKTSSSEREFALGMFPLSLFLPAVSAGLLAIPTHTALCKRQ